MLTRRKPMTRTTALRRTTRRMRDWRLKHPLGTRARVKQDLHEAVSMIVRLRDGRCVLCGETDWQKLTCGHFYKRGWIGTAFDLRNCHALCRECNARDNYDHMPYLDYMLRTFGPDTISELFELRNSTRRILDAELEAMLSEFRLQLKRKAR